MILQPEFEGLVRAADERCLTRFNRRLAAAYLAGSVALGEAWPGASDLDWFVFLRDEPTLADKAWRRRVQKRLEDEFPAASEVRLKLFSQERLRREGFWRFILRYNSRRVRGDNLIAAFEQRTGIPVLLNTSFNVRGEPIVCTPVDAYQCFMRTEIDYLVLGPFLLDKKLQPEWKESRDWRTEFQLD